MAKAPSIKVGSLLMKEYSRRESGEVFWAGRGELTTLARTYAIGLKPSVRGSDAPPATEDTPTHAVWLLQNGEATAQLGVAWEREIKRGDFTGKPMFSIALNHPDLPAWTKRIAAFPRDENGTYSIEHRDDAGEPQPQRPTNFDDEIPY